jgi:putative phage-type endonuclease
VPALTPANDAIRAVNVTASEVGALMGPHPYTSAARIYDRLTNSPNYEPSPHSEAMDLGVWFEKRIAQYTAKRLGLRLRANTRTVRHPQYALAATPDYLVLRSRMLVECKLSSIMYGWSEDKLADHIEWQARAQLACTNRQTCFVAALVGSQFYTIPVVRDMDKEREMLWAVARFSVMLAEGVRPPEPDIPQVRKIRVESSKG